MIHPERPRLINTAAFYTQIFGCINAYLLTKLSQPKIIEDNLQAGYDN